MLKCLGILLATVQKSHGKATHFVFFHDPPTSCHVVFESRSALVFSVFRTVGYSWTQSAVLSWFCMSNRRRSLTERKRTPIGNLTSRMSAQEKNRTDKSKTNDGVKEGTHRHLSFYPFLFFCFHKMTTQGWQCLCQHDWKKLHKFISLYIHSSSSSSLFECRIQVPASCWYGRVMFSHASTERTC